MLDTAARKIVLERGWLTRTPPSFQRVVLGHCRLQCFEAGAIVYNLGDPPGGMYGVVSGSIGITVAPQEEGPYFAHIGRPGDWFGEMAAFTGEPRAVGIIVRRKARLLHLPLPAIREITSESSDAWRLLALVTHSHLTLAIGATDDLMIRDDFQRFIAILLRLGDCRRPYKSRTSAGEIDANQEDLALMANLARNTVGVFLRRLEAAGHIERSYRLIRIANPDALRALVLERKA